MEWYESRKNVEINIWLNPKCFVIMDVRAENFLSYEIV